MVKPASKIDPEDFNVQFGLKSVNDEIKKRDELLNVEIDPYIENHILIENVRIERVTGDYEIYCTIKNTGDRVIRDLVGRISYYTDDDDKLISVEKLSHLMFFKDPILPGISLDITDRLINTPFEPEVWKNTKIKVDIIEIE